MSKRTSKRKGRPAPAQTGPPWWRDPRIVAPFFTFVLGPICLQLETGIGALIKMLVKHWLGSW